MALTLLAGVVVMWLSLRTMMLVMQVNRFAPESRLGRAFQRELINRGLIPSSDDRERLMASRHG